MLRPRFLCILPMIILAGTASSYAIQSRRILRSLSFGRSGGGGGSDRISTHGPLYWHRSGRGKLLTSNNIVVQGVVGPSNKWMSDVRPHLHHVTAVGNDSTEQDLDAVQVASSSDNYCYLIQSLDPNRPLKTYIGFTTNPPKRLRQHNGEITRGARRTTSGRPWKYVAVIRGFQDKVSAMQFEWAWQHVDRSKVFREAVGCDSEARKMKRRRGVVARMNELRILLNDCDQFHKLPLKFYYLDEAYRELFCNGAGHEDDLNQYCCSDDDILGGMKDEYQTFNDVNQMTVGSPITSVKYPTLTERIHVCQSRRIVNSITRNTLVPMGARPKSNWALDAVSEYVRESSKDDNMDADNVEQILNIPSKFKPYPFVYHQELTVRIESLTNLGFGIARVELDDDEEEDVSKKWVVFVPNVIPSELVRIRIYRNFASYSDADLLEIIEPSADRVEPNCPLATVCGGCQYQHITIELQRKMKTMQVQELFERLGGFERTEFPAVLDTLGTEEVFGYRSKITPHYDAPLRKGSKNMPSSPGIVCEIGPIGFKEKASHRLVDVPHCHIATPAINEALVQIRNEKREEARQDLLKKPKKGATLLLRDADGVVETNHTAYVTTTVKDLVFRFQAGNFFQNNPFMLPKMVDLVVEAATKESPSGNAMTHLIDCYCGSGLFCLGSASAFDVCVGIEVNDVAVAEARENAVLNGIRNCAFISASAEAIFHSREQVKVSVTKDADNECESLIVDDFPRETTVVVVDPPRKGCSEEFLEQLNNFRPARVVYMSCDPATQARDARSLVSFGYQIASIQPFDLFPQTRHIECLAVFERRS